MTSKVDSCLPDVVCVAVVSAISDLYVDRKNTKNGMYCLLVFHNGRCTKDGEAT